MTAETAFLSAVTTFLKDVAGLSPTPHMTGVREPESNTDMPALVLSLETSARSSSGLGARSDVMAGALRWNATIDLADPTLPNDPETPLLDGTRRLLTLYHGGLVRADGSRGPLSAADLSVTVAAAVRPVVTTLPTGDEVRADADSGILGFATALPETGFVEIGYFIGQWERRVTRISGTLLLDVCAVSANVVETLSMQAVESLLEASGAGIIPGLREISLFGLSTIARPDLTRDERRRSARFHFEFDDVVDRPDSSGGVIRTVLVKQPKPPLPDDAIVTEEFKITRPKTP